MNTLILDLLEQAGVKYSILPKDTVYAKFAELIIKECMNICVNTRIGNREYNQVRMDCQYDIAKHFGVES